VFDFYSHNSFQVSNDTHSNIQLEAFFGEILLELFSSGNFILVNDYWSPGCLTNYRLVDCVHMKITLDCHTSYFFSFIFQYFIWEEVSSFQLLGTKAHSFDLFESYKTNPNHILHGTLKNDLNRTYQEYRIELWLEESYINKFPINNFIFLFLLGTNVHNRLKFFFYCLLSIQLLLLIHFVHMTT
jgi:hypothetical protein